MIALRARKTPLAMAGWAVLLMVAMTPSGCGGNSSNLTELHRLKSGTVDVVVLSPNSGFQHGRDTFFIEFRSNGNLTDVGNDVRASATMPMPGMPMFGSIDVQRTEIPGRYRATGEFSMAGAWRLTVEWNGPGGRGSVTFTAAVL